MTRGGSTASAPLFQEEEASHERPSSCLPRFDPISIQQRADPEPSLKSQLGFITGKSKKTQSAWLVTNQEKHGRRRGVTVTLDGEVDLSLLLLVVVRTDKAKLRLEWGTVD